MWPIILRDLQFRRRQFGIAVFGAGLAFALALALTGMSSGFRREASDTVTAIGAGAWIVPGGVTGPFTSISSIPASVAREVSGGGQVEPLAEYAHTARVPSGEHVNVIVIGHSIGALGDPVWGRGAGTLPRGQAVVDTRLGAKNGQSITIASHTLRIVGVVHDRTLFAGVPVVYMSLAEAQAIAFGGRPAATTIVTRGVPSSVPPGFAVLTNTAVRNDELKRLDGAVGSIDLTRLLTWIMAMVVIGAVMYLSALERLRDFAVLKAVGGSPGKLVVSLAAQAVLASLLAALVGVVLVQLLGPAFPIRVAIEPATYVVLPLVAVIVGILASLAAVRRITKVDPALAFAG